MVPPHHSAPSERPADRIRCGPRVRDCLVSTPVADVDVDRLDLLILFRLASPVKRPTPSHLRRSLARWVVPPVSRTDWPRLFDARVRALEGRGWVEGLRATEAGRERLQERIGVASPQWRRARPTIAALALGLEASAVRGADGLAAGVLADAYGLELEAPTLARVVDQIVHRQLTGAPGTLTLAGARKALLEQALGRPVSGDWTAAARALAAQHLGVIGAEAAQLTAGLAEQWVRGEANAIDDPLARFAAGARNAAELVPPEGRFGRNRVFIAALHEVCRRLPFARGQDLPSFKEQLVEAHRSGLLVLHRADLVGAMDGNLVSASEVQYLHATFHFLGTEPVRSAP